MLALSPAPVSAQGGAERYAVKGVGRLPCSEFVAARSAPGERLALFAGWIDGYVSAANRYDADTYDLAPWQTVELLAAKLAAFCSANPQTPFAAAMDALAGVLAPDRLTEAGPLVALRVGDQAVFLYAEVVARIRAALRLRGFEPGDGSGGDARLGEALRAFQASNGIAPSGLPDQPTLNALLR